MTFHVKRLIANACWKTGTPAVWEDLTAEFLDKRDPDLRIVKSKLGGRMTAETARNLALADKMPAANTKPGMRRAGHRASQYVFAMTGIKPHKILFADAPLPGEKHVRPCAWLDAGGTRFGIPHWDWQPAAPVEETI